MPECLMRILFDKGTLRPLRRRLFGHDVETSVAGFRGRARGSAGGWRPGPLFFAGRGPPALGSGRAVIRAWHFKAGAVNVFSGLRAPAAPSLTVNTAFVSPVGWYLFSGGPVCSPAPCRGLIAPDFPGLVPGLVVLGPVVVWPDAGVSSGVRRRLLVPRVYGVGQAIRLDAARAIPAALRGRASLALSSGRRGLLPCGAGPMSGRPTGGMLDVCRGFRRCGRRPTGRPAWP